MCDSTINVNRHYIEGKYRLIVRGQLMSISHLIYSVIMTIVLLIIIKTK